MPAISCTRHGERCDGCKVKLNVSPTLHQVLRTLLNDYHFMRICNTFHRALQSRNHCRCRYYSSVCYGRATISTLQTSQRTECRSGRNPVCPKCVKALFSHARRLSPCIFAHEWTPSQQFCIAPMNAELLQRTIVASHPCAATAQGGKGRRAIFTSYKSGS